MNGEKASRLFKRALLMLRAQLTLSYLASSTRIIRLELVAFFSLSEKLVDSSGAAGPVSGDRQIALAALVFLHFNSRQRAIKPWHCDRF